jgi:hypothetical protein
MQAAGVALDNLLNEITTPSNQQSEPLTGKTQDRNKVFDAASDMAYSIARLVLGHALAHGLGDLAAKVDIPASELGRSRFTRRVELMRQIHTAASSVIPQVTDSTLTPAMLTEFRGKIDAAEAVLTAPRSNIATRRVATENVERSVIKLEQLLRYTLDPLMELRRTDDPDGYVLYSAARLVIDRPGDPAEEETPATPAHTSQATPPPPPAA